jgi:hypothetical protein
MYFILVAKCSQVHQNLSQIWSKINKKVFKIKFTPFICYNNSLETTTKALRYEIPVGLRRGF